MNPQKGEPFKPKLIVAIWKKIPSKTEILDNIAEVILILHVKYNLYIKKSILCHRLKFPILTIQPKNGEQFRKLPSKYTKNAPRHEI